MNLQDTSSAQNQELLYQLNITFPGAASATFQNFLSENAPWGWEEKSTDLQTIFILHCDRAQQAERLSQAFCAAFPTIKTEILQTPKLDWGSAWRDFFTPIQVGRFIVLPTWLKEEPRQATHIPLIIEPKMAFGTGHHNTTSLCLQAVDILVKENYLIKGQHFLDLGTGSGILGIAAALAGLTGIGLDIDSVAIDNARENCRLNKVQKAFQPLVGSLHSLEADSRFDLIMANILSKPLIDMAPQLISFLSAKGSLLLSGILKEQAPNVINTYKSQGLPAPQILHEQEWVALLWKQLSL